jgi:hypothetical protein
MLNLVGLQYASQYHFTFELSIAKKYTGFPFIVGIDFFVYSTIYYMFSHDWTGYLRLWFYQITFFMYTSRHKQRNC